jgi:halimadienyl-diphosphate synthase
MNLNQEIHNLLKKIGPGHMMTTAYDTAWIVRLGEIGEVIGEEALEWLRDHQLSDGSWGAPQPRYFHDRVICTLAAMNAMAQRGRARDRERLRRAESALELASKGLGADPTGETIGFELIVPTLLHEAKALGGIQTEESEVLGQLAPRRAAKLAALPHGMISRYVTVAFSAEMAGPDGRRLLDIENLQEADGSVSFSPSATAYFALYVKRRDPAALAYLRNITIDGAAPNVAPFDVFEQAWTLWNLSLIGDLDEATLALCQPHLDFLENAWVPGVGAGFAANYAPKDGDETSVVYEALTHFGRTVDVEAIFQYEEETHFRCFALEANPSISANIHVLSALRKTDFNKHHPAVQKVLHFLLHARAADMFWVDKWHASPYYATAHAIMACIGYNNIIVEEAAEWLLTTQDHDGAWGYYMPTAEETAYCLQALTLWKRHGGHVSDNVLKRGALWLADHAEPPYPPLWIGKCLYCPEMVVRSAVLSALMLVNQE